MADMHDMQFQCETDELVGWILRVRLKERALKRCRIKNLRVEAISNKALAKAGTLWSLSGYFQMQSNYQKYYFETIRW
jgi:hypothetical protein